MLPEADYAHMRVHLPKLHGYYLWKKAESIDGSQRIKEKLTLLSAAYGLTRDASQSDPENVTLNNNMLYYSMELKRLVSGTEFASKYTEITDAFERHLAALEGKCPPGSCNDIIILDTLLQAYDILERRDGVINMLDRLSPLIDSDIANTACDKDIFLEIQKEATRLRKKYI